MKRLNNASETENSLKEHLISVKHCSKSAFDRDGYDIKQRTVRRNVGVLKFLAIINVTTFDSCNVHFSDTRVRLTGYNLTHAGRVEVFSNGIWGRVCNVWGSWHQKEAAVVCRQLGFQGVIAAFSYPSDSAQFVVMSRVQCVGNETSLQQCQHDDFVNIVPLHSCKDVEVICKPHSFNSNDGGEYF